VWPLETLLMLLRRPIPFTPESYPKLTLYVGWLDRRYYLIDNMNCTQTAPDVRGAIKKTQDIADLWVFTEK
ncbi:MAG: hypothetical protein ACM3PS_11270, partial [Syntrophothermus sp.]